MDVIAIITLVAALVTLASSIVLHRNVKKLKASSLKAVERLESIGDDKKNAKKQ